MSARRLAAALACVVLVGALAACSRTSAEQTSGGYVTGESGVITVVGAGDREPAPDIAGESLDGEQVALSDFRGKTVVVNVWGSWCGPCRQEAPTLVEVSEAYADQDVQFLGVVIRDQLASARAFEERAGKAYPSIFDPSSQTLIGFADSLPSAAIPTTWIIDDQGRVAARVLNPASASTLSALIDDVQSGKVRQGDG